jgi:dihydrofolate reductase
VAQGLVICDLSISLDGFIAGPDQSADQPLGIGGRRLHEWHFSPKNEVDRRFTHELLEPKGAVVMGRNMFGPIRGAWDGEWNGWWGGDPPYHAPVFVLTHHARDPEPMAGGTTFHFVTDGAASALAQAREAAGDKPVLVAGGAQTARQCLAAGAVDELVLHVVPAVLGSGERLFDDLGGLACEPLEACASPAATHIRYRVVGR